ARARDRPESTAATRWSPGASPLAEGRVRSKRAGLDDHVFNVAAVPEDAVPLAQVPIDGGAAGGTDIEPLMHAVHQCRAEVAPLARAPIQHDPAAAGTAAQR